VCRYNAGLFFSRCVNVTVMGAAQGGSGSGASGNADAGADADDARERSDSSRRAAAADADADASESSSSGSSGSSGSGAAGGVGVIDGRGFKWWETAVLRAVTRAEGWRDNRPNIIDFVNSTDIVIEHITLRNAPAFHVRTSNSLRRGCSTS
jgi:hypothetical protein